MAFLESQLILRRCPHCRVDSPNLMLIQKYRTADFDGQEILYWGFYNCKKCGGVVTAMSYDGEDGAADRIYPSEIQVDESLPSKAKAFLNQAIDSLHAPSGAVMLAASSIDAMLKEKGYKDGSLYHRINQAAIDHLITNEMAKWAHEVRLDANDERHADENAELPDSRDAKKTVDFALALAEFLFVLPSRVERGLEDAAKG